MSPWADRDISRRRNNSVAFASAKRTSVGVTGLRGSVGLTHFGSPVLRLPAMRIDPFGSCLASSTNSRQKCLPFIGRACLSSFQSCRMLFLLG